MLNHAAGIQLNRAASRQAARGNVGTSVLLRGAAINQHMVGINRARCRRCPWSPWLSQNWLVRRSFRRDLIRMSLIIPLAASVPIHETVVMAGPSNQLTVLPAESTVKLCSQHSIVDLPEIIEVTFDQEGKKTTLYADRKCSRCGQHFFCYPSEAAPPYTPPGFVAPAAPFSAGPSPQAKAASAPIPAQTMHYPPAQTMNYPPAQTMHYPPVQTMNYPPAQTMNYQPNQAAPIPAQTVNYPPAQTMHYPPAQTMNYPPAQTVNSPPTQTMNYPPTQTMSSPPTQAMNYPSGQLMHSPPAQTLNSPPTQAQPTNNFDQGALPPASNVVSAQKACLQCGQNSLGSSKFCGHCGGKMPTYCPCGGALADNVKFCSSCGRNAS